MDLNEMRDRAYEQSKKSGFHSKGEQVTVGDRLMLMVTEIAEAMEDFRSGMAPQQTHYDGASRKPCGIPFELADVVIRIGDFCGLYDIDLDKAVQEKIEYNSKRPYMHGGKVL
jgi:NTP pyrophosphatase (non-canonical NTP hydrolase)